MYDEAGLIGDEARDVAPNNTQNLDFYAPTVNLSRDPRWGRNDETWSEDPTLTGALASQYVNGLQGQDENGRLPKSANGYLKAIATLKHFAANNSEVNRRTGSSDMDQRTLREYYTAQFRDIIAQSDPGSIMSSYNEVNGVPAAASVQLMDTLARETFGFSGYFTSDCDAVYEIQAGHHWQPPGASAPLDQYGRTAYANSAGEDLDCNAGYHDQYNYGNTIPTAIAKHITTQTDVYNEGDVDTSLVRLFTARIETGEFDAQTAGAVGEGGPGSPRAGHLDQLRRQQRRDRDPQPSRHGPESGRPEPRAAEECASRQGEERSPAAQGSLVGCLQGRGDGVLRQSVIVVPRRLLEQSGHPWRGQRGQPLPGCKGGDPADRPQRHRRLLPGRHRHRPEHGRPGLRRGGEELQRRHRRRRHRLRHRGRGPRPHHTRPAGRAGLADQPGREAANPDTVVYLETMGQVDTSGFQPQLPAMLWSSYNGQRQGAALADVLLGNANPSGQLPFTWYGNLNQLPAIGDYSIRPTATTDGRTYMYFTGNVTYPFGYGLSYTDFSYSNLRVDKPEVDANGTLHVTADITNRGSKAGATVPQLYVSTPFEPASAQRPIKRLEAFQKVTIAAHRTRRVEFTVRVPTFAFFDETANRYKVDPGAYQLQLATSSAGVAARASVRVGGTLRPTPSVLTAKPVQTGDAARGVAQRVMFADHTTVDPQLTVSMDDESIYGYINRGAGVALPKGLTVTYRSDRSQVVRVDRNQTIRTVGAGVATISATVHYNGRTATTTFVIHVSS